MNTQVRSFAADMVAPHPMPLAEMAWVGVLWGLQGLLQVAALGISMPAGLALLLITFAKGGIADLIQTHTSEKQP